MLQKQKQNQDLILLQKVHEEQIIQNMKLRNTHMKTML